LSVSCSVCVSLPNDDGVACSFGGVDLEGGVELALSVSSSRIESIKLL
jgi:hypothetical protein